MKVQAYQVLTSEPYKSKAKNPKTLRPISYTPVLNHAFPEYMSHEEMIEQMLELLRSHGCSGTFQFRRCLGGREGWVAYPGVYQI